MTVLLMQGEGSFPVISKALQYGGNLTIPHLTKDDQGSYECVASNPVTNVITSSLLIIECTPVVIYLSTCQCTILPQLFSQLPYLLFNLRAMRVCHARFIYYNIKKLKVMIKTVVECVSMITEMPLWSGGQDTRLPRRRSSVRIQVRACYFWCATSPPSCDGYLLYAESKKNGKERKWYTTMRFSELSLLLSTGSEMIIGMFDMDCWVSEVVICLPAVSQVQSLWATDGCIVRRHTTIAHANELQLRDCEHCHIVRSKQIIVIFDHLKLQWS